MKYCTIKLKLIFLLYLLTVPFLSYLQTDIYDSGGEPIPEQKSYDVIFYDLSLSVIPDNKWIEGEMVVTVKALEPFKDFVLHLDTTLSVKQVNFPELSNEQSILWHRDRGLIWIHANQEFNPGDVVTVKINYEGHPLSAATQERGTWSDGFFWKKTTDGKPWIGNVSVLNGADIWWPCKDHPADEPDSMSLRVSVPKGLVVAANGKLRSKIAKGDQIIYHWFISTPINNYAVTINIAPYRTIRQTFKSTSGDTFPFIFWVLPEHYEQGKKQFPLFIRDMEFFENLLGPYPFRADKYGIAETYYLGMETQSIIAYGHNYTSNEYGFDFLHFHELAHEWFANMVTAKDWKHWWVHEGFATYTEALYAEHLLGKDAYHKYVAKFIKNSKNQYPVVLSKPHVTARTGYIGDVYSKGAAILHTLRFLLKKEGMMRFLRKAAYPDSKLEKVVDGSHCRLVTTQDIENLAEQLYGKELDWFFDSYLLHADLPELIVKKKKKKLKLTWNVAGNTKFNMPVPIRFASTTKLVSMKSSRGKIKVKNHEYHIDPENWILKKLTTE